MFFYLNLTDFFLLPVLQCSQLMGVSPRQIVQLLQFVKNPAGFWWNNNAPEVEQNRFLRRHRTWKLPAVDLETLQFACDCSGGGCYWRGLFVRLLPSGLTDAVAPPTGRAQSCSVLLSPARFCSAHIRPVHPAAPNLFLFHLFYFFFVLEQNLYSRNTNV